MPTKKTKQVLAPAPSGKVVKGRSARPKISPTGIPDYETVGDVPPPRSSQRNVCATKMTRTSRATERIRVRKRVSKRASRVNFIESLGSKQKRSEFVHKFRAFLFYSSLYLITVMVP